MGGSLKQEELYEIKNIDPYSLIENFVETGTYKAESTLLAASHYKNVYTIEIHKPLYIESRILAENNNITNITFILGDTLEKLHDIMPLVSKGSIFFIDAHISSIDSGYNLKNPVPMFEELNIILSYPLGPSVFILDDIRLWNDPDKLYLDWSHIDNEKICQIFTNKGKGIKSCFTANDRFFIFTL